MRSAPSATTSKPGGRRARRAPGGPNTSRSTTSKPAAHTSAGLASWCYGTPGIARAGQLAGIALQDQTLQRVYEDALHRCITDPAQLAHVTDSSLCHGWAGLHQTVFRAAGDARTPHLSATLPALSNALLAHARPGAPKRPGLLEGDAGCALALTTIADQAPNNGWDACLLID
jgi:lantibiotic biosynthesis protein